MYLLNFKLIIKCRALWHVCFLQKAFEYSVALIEDSFYKGF